MRQSGYGGVRRARVRVDVRSEPAGEPGDFRALCDGPEDVSGAIRVSRSDAGD